MRTDLRIEKYFKDKLWHNSYDQYIEQILFLINTKLYIPTKPNTCLGGFQLWPCDTFLYVMVMDIKVIYSVHYYMHG